MDNAASPVETRSADALTEAAKICDDMADANERLGPASGRGSYIQKIGTDSMRRCAAAIRAILAASPVEQHEAAPADSAEEMRDAAMRTVQAMGLVYTPGSDRWRPGPAQPALSAPLEGTGNGATAQGEIYQISFADEEGWCDTNKKVFDAHPVHARRIVYRAPRTEVAGAVPIAWVWCDTICPDHCHSTDAEAIEEGWIPLVYGDPKAVQIADEKRSKIEAAIKVTEYKYFGMYEFTEAQHDAVDVLVEAARTFLSAPHIAPQPPSADAAAAPEDERAAFNADALDFEPDARHAVADMANIGYALLEQISRMAPGYHWNDSPVEIVSDLINERDEARAAASQAAAAAGQEAVEAASTKTHQVWVEETSSWADVTPAYYSERLPSNRRIVYYTAPPAQVATQIDIETMLRACVPGGDIVDPQLVCDNIREWFAEHGAQVANRQGLTEEQITEVRSATIERCAQLVDRIAKSKCDRGSDDALVRSIAARIRALLEGDKQ